MSNDDVYAGGLLNRALDPATQPAAVRAFLRAEIDLLDETISAGIRLIDFGCGTGRHLLALGQRLGFSVGLDYEHSSIAEAANRNTLPQVHFITSDATAVPISGKFDFAMCLTNTWGTMENKAGVLSEMRRLAPNPGTRLLSVYSTASVAARQEWYGRLGHRVSAVTDEYLLTEGGFRSEHFSEDRLRAIVGPCTVRPLSEIGYVVRF
jgi:SAM-dependent methyltransferase